MSSTDNLSEARVVVLGGTSGVGLAVAQRAASQGASVVIAGRDEARLQNALAQIAGTVSGEIADGSNAGQMHSLFERVGLFDHLVITLSGAKGGGPFRDLDLQDLREGFDAKFWAHVTAAQAALPYLRHGGSITFVTAISARRAYLGTAGLAAINAAIEALVPVLAVELKPLRVNAVSPGVIDTPWWDRVPESQRQALFAQSAAQTPVGRVGQPDDVARAVIFLLEDTFMTGTVLECDGGIRLVG